jgi:hypothetical protein
MKKIMPLCLIISLMISISSFKPEQETKTVFVYAVITSAEFKKAVFTDVFRITIEKRNDSYLESAEKNIAVQRLEAAFKKHMYVTESWDKYVTVAGFYDGEYSKLTDRKSDEMARQKGNDYTPMTTYNFSFTYKAGDYKN